MLQCKSLLPAFALAFVTGGTAAPAQNLILEYDIIGPPSAQLRQILAAAALDDLKDLPSVPGSEISDEMVVRSAQKLHVVCVRRIVPSGGGVAYTVTGVTLVKGIMPQQAFAHLEACDDRSLKYHPFPEMHGTRKAP